MANCKICGCAMLTEWPHGDAAACINASRAKNESLRAEVEGLTERSSSDGKREQDLLNTLQAMESRAEQAERERDEAAGLEWNPADKAQIKSVIKERRKELAA